MGVLDKFLDAIKLNEDDDAYLDDDDMLEDEEDEFLDDDLEESKPRRGSFLGRFSSKRASGEDLDDLDDLDDEDERPVRKAPRSTPPKKTVSRSSSVRNTSRFSSSDLDEDIQEEPEIKKPAAKPARTSSKITPMRASRRSGASAGNTAVCVIKPSSMENTREIVDTLVDNSTVVLNLEGIDMELAQRIIDFTSGATYSLGGTLTRVSSYIFILGPHNVDITGDLQNILGGSSPSVRAGY